MDIAFRPHGSGLSGMSPSSFVAGSLFSTYVILAKYLVCMPPRLRGIFCSIRVSGQVRIGDIALVMSWFIRSERAYFYVFLNLDGLMFGLRDVIMRLIPIKR